MPKVIRCPSCQARYQIADAMLGRKFKCSKCGQALQLGPAQPAQAAQVGQSQAARSAVAPSRTRSSLLDEELAIEAAKAQAAAQAQRDAELDEEFGEGKPAEAPKIQCPHCDYEIGAHELYCPACGLTVQSARVDPKQRSKEEAKDVLYGVVAIILAMVLSPLLFLGVQMVLGPFVAMFITAIMVNVIVSIGSFSLACRLFKQEPPETGEIFRVLCWSWLPNMVLNWFGSTGLASMLVAMVLSVLISAMLCAVTLEFPFVKAIGICIAYNILAFVLALVAILLLAAIFITMVDIPDNPPAGAPMPGAPAEGPGALPPGDAGGGAADPQARIRPTVDPALVLRWLEANAV